MFIVIIILSSLLGLAVGSFLNCVIFRLEKGESFWRGRSHCFSCKKILRWQDLIPVFSFACRRGRCHYCGKKISWQYPLVELAAALLFGLAAIFQPATDLVNWLSWLLRDWLFISFLIIIFVYDFKHYLILDKVIWPAVIFAVLLNLSLHFPLMILILGAVFGTAFFLLQYTLSRGRWLGGGDVRLGLLLGLMLGWPGIVMAITIAYFIGSVFSLFLIISKKKSWRSQLPLGTFLTVAAVITMFWGEQILQWYLSLIGY